MLLANGLVRIILSILRAFEVCGLYFQDLMPLAVYLAGKVGLSPQVAGSLVGAFSGVLCFLPVLQEHWRTGTA